LLTPSASMQRNSAASNIIQNTCGYPVQTYAVRTVDGYILTLIRIPRPESSKVVFFQHGLLDSASAWVSTGNVHSLASRAYQQGYDVFLGNFRGSNDALGVNGLGANPSDYGEQVGSKQATGMSCCGRKSAQAATTGPVASSSSNTSTTMSTAAGTSTPLSPLRGHRMRSLSLENVDNNKPGRGRSNSNCSISERFGYSIVGTSLDGIPVHETLHPRQSEYWNYGCDDHALDMLAFIRHIRVLKRAERKSRKAVTVIDAGTGSSPLPEHDVDTRDEDADDPSYPSIVAVGHSMGGCVSLLYVLVCRALQKPHFLRKLILLSPAGVHNKCGIVPQTTLLSLYYAGLLKRNRPFPMRSSTVQRVAARLLQDVSRFQATGDLLAMVSSSFFGGVSKDFVFRYVPLSQYPVGGTNNKVVVHGIQCMLAREFQAYDYNAAENQRRYGSTKPPSYRLDYGLYDIPIHFIAGGQDMLVPVENLEEQYLLLHALHPELISMKVCMVVVHSKCTCCRKSIAC
jgi:pimeloyl-ACP methyl ester carboxylesterase